MPGFLDLPEAAGVKIREDGQSHWEVVEEEDHPKNARRAEKRFMEGFLTAKLHEAIVSDWMRETMRPLLGIARPDLPEEMPRIRILEPGERDEREGGP